MKKFIVITSIYDPTEAVRAFSRFTDYQVVVVGDKKTVEGWSCDNVLYLPVEEHANIAGHIDKLLPYNHYSRKMIGYSYAIANGADHIIDTDDDNIPGENWVFPDFEGVFSCIDQGNGFVNIYQYYSGQKIWPRGFPLSLINTDFDIENKIVRAPCKVGVWQGLADGDPDVDAIYRLTNNSFCHFKDRDPIVLLKNTACPFNSQNTLIRKELFPLLYLPSFVSFRFCDILRGLVAQPIMWLYDYHLGFTGATVVQRRNFHDYFQDFISEIPMYENVDKVIDIICPALSKSKSINDNIFAAYKALYKQGVIVTRELSLLEAWLADF